MSPRPSRPADELAQLRAELARLRVREAHLVRLMLEDPYARRGDRCQAEVWMDQRKRFRVEKLPGAIRSDPDLWDVEDVPVVTVKLSEPGITAAHLPIEEDVPAVA